MRVRRSFLVAAAILMASCAARTNAPKVADPTATRPSRLYPLAEGNVWSFDVDDGSGEPLLIVARVVRAAGARFEVSSGGGEPIPYEVRPDGIYRRDLDAYLLKAPIRKGATWSTGNGLSARVVAVDEAVSTPSGELEGCVRIEEAGGGEQRTIVTVYCPGVGPAYLDSRLRLDTAATEVRVTATLRGWSVAE